MRTGGGLRRNLTVVLMALIALPLVAMAWLGTRVVRDERELRTDRMDDLLAARLDDVDTLAGRVLEGRRQELRQALDDVGPDSIIQLPRQVPTVVQGFIRDTEGELVHPNPRGPLSDDEREFLRRTRHLWEGEDSLRRSPDAVEAGDDGWYGWFWDSGLHLLYWRRTADGHVIGAELGRMRLMADVVAELPITDPDDPAQLHDRIVLLDARGAAIYQWGRHEPQMDEVPRVKRALSPPLGAWTLEYYVSEPGIAAATSSGTALGLSAGLLALCLALAGLGAYFHRESSREIREASLRVDFVNQVSHELKTPLTNIRMYAELLQRNLDPVDVKAARHVGIIVSESQRLSRLIGNVLTFARQRRDALVLRPVAGCLDDTVGEILTQFGPALETRGVEVRYDDGAPQTVEFDADVVTQVVANLMSNVEKYAAGGGLLAVATSIEGDLATVTVGDHGPGIPEASAARVFEPFVRLHDAVTEGAAGAGIGLALARDLARLHGGDLVLRPARRGALFAFTFRCGGSRGEEA